MTGINRTGVNRTTDKRLSCWRALLTAALAAAWLTASVGVSAQSIMPRAPEIAGSSYILIDATTGHVIMEQNSEEALPPA
ncbi:MAG: hypothetical protein WD600_12560, partial [Pseudohongiella sp.]